MQDHYLARLAFLIVICLAFSGCASDRPESASVPVPAVGEKAVFQGSDGSRLSVEVIGNGQRYDAFRTLVDVVILEFRLFPARNPDVEIRFEESVLTGVGSHIRQDLYCHFGTGIPPQTSQACIPGFVRVFFGGHGLPGGLLDAMFWGRSLPDGPEFVIATDALAGPRSHPYSVERESNGCVTLSNREPPSAAGFYPWMPATVLAGPVVTCPGEAFPRQFVSHMKMPSGLSEEPFPIFTKVESSVPAGGPLVAWDPPAEAPDPSRPNRTARGPLYLLSEDTQYLDFASAEAHREALEADSTYAAFFDPDRAGFVAHASYGGGGIGTLADGAVRQETNEWRLAVRDGAGRGYSVRVAEVTTTWPGDQKTTERTVDNHSERGWKGRAPAATTAHSFIDARAAYRLATQLVGQPMAGATHSSETFSGGLYFFPKVTTDDRYWITAFFRPPDAAPPSYIPWHVTVDAANGAIVHAQISPTLHDSV